MAEIKVAADIAGRVCAIAASAGSTVGDGDDIVLIESMKMEIPVPASAAGKVREILVSIDDVVAEGQVIAILET